MKNETEIKERLDKYMKRLIEKECNECPITIKEDCIVQCHVLDEVQLQINELKWVLEN